MKHRRTRISRMGIYLALALGLTACSGFKTFSLESGPILSSVRVDGAADEWLGRLTMLADRPVSVGLVNDDENLFFCLTSDDRALSEQIRRNGLILWIDPHGGTRKILGLQFPLGLESGKGPDQGRSPGRGMNPETDRPGMGGHLDAEPAGLPEPREFGVIQGRSKKPGRIQLDSGTGIEMKINFSAGRLVYEARIPLVRTPNHPWAVGAEGGAMIGFGLETAEAVSSRRSQGPGGDPGEGGPPMDGGGMGGGGGMTGGMGGGPGGGPGRERGTDSSAKLKLWVSLTLAEGSGKESAGIFPR